MKFRPIKIDELTSTIEETRYNDNTVGITSLGSASNANSDKRDYATLTLISIMQEKGLLKHELINESFNGALNVVSSYEGKQ